MNKPLGRRAPQDLKHIRKYPLRSLLDEPVSRVEKRLKLPHWHWQHDQGKEGACVGFALSMMMSIINEQEARSVQTKPYIHLYNSRWLWEEAKKVDEWEDTQPGDDNGTSVRAGCDVLRTLGHQRLNRRRVNMPASIDEGIQENRWATTVDEVRTSISKGVPVVFGIDWMSAFDKPEKVGNEWWIAKSGDQGHMRGGHAICCYGASDRRQAFALKNSWGRDYPLVWIPYKVIGELIAPDRMGEACLVSDKKRFS